MYTNVVLAKWIPLIVASCGLFLILLNGLFHFASQPLPNGIWYVLGCLLIATGLTGFLYVNRNQG